MIKSISYILLSLICLSLNAADTYKQAYQKMYMPDELKDVYIGISFSSFIKLKDISGMEIDSAYANTYIKYTDTKLPSNIVSLSYKFGMKDDYETALPLPTSPLYEIDIEFAESTDMNALTKKLFGAPKDIYKPTDQYHFYDKQWIIKTKDNLTLMIRQTDYYMMIAGVIKGTEWSND